MRAPTGLLALAPLCLAACLGPSETGARPFDPEFFQHSEHLALRLVVVRGDLALSRPVLERRPGSLPFRSAQAGPVAVIWSDAAGRELGRRTYRDAPPFAEDGALDVLLPADPRIAWVEIALPDRTQRRFDVEAPIRTALGRRP